MIILESTDPWVDIVWVDTSDLSMNRLISVAIIVLFTKNWWTPWTHHGKQGKTNKRKQGRIGRPAWEWKNRERGWLEMVETSQKDSWWVEQRKERKEELSVSNQSEGQQEDKLWRRK